MVQGSEGRGHANQDDRWTRRRDKSAAPARHSRSQDTTGARPPPSPWPAVGRWPRRKREGSRGAERRWRGDQDQVDSRRENVCACSSAVGEYAYNLIINSHFGSKLLAARLPRTPPACGGRYVVAQPRQGFRALRLTPRRRRQHCWRRRRRRPRRRRSLRSASA